MNKRTFLSAIFAFTLLSGFAQKNEVVVMHIDGKPINVSEFKNIYEKNNPNPDYSKEALDEYLDLFVNFKLKVAEARNEGYDTIPSITRELKGYRTQLAQPYLVDKQMTEGLIKEAYDRLQQEVKASHILVKLPPKATPEDTLKAYNKIIELRNQVVNERKDFSSVAKKSSDDPSASQNGGSLGYFTALQMVYPFENAAYETKVGEVSKPVRTRFGYHILKVHDKRPARGKMTAAHIMIALDKNPSESDLKDAENKINEIYDMLKDGDDFAEMASKYSDDNSSKMRGGRLPEFGSGTQQRMVPEFEDAAFGLKNDGSFSEPFKTQFGYHIVQRVSLDPLPSYEKMKPDLKSKINKDSRSEKTKNSFIQKLKNEYKFKDYSEKRMSEIISFVDSSIFNFEWKVPELTSKNMTKKIFKFSDKEYSGDQFLSFLENNQRRYRSKSIEEWVKNPYNSFVDEEIYNYESERLEDKYPDFCQLMMEYRDGILLFEITEDKVWGKAMKDTTGLKKFYEAHKNEHMWPVRYNIVYFDCNSKDVAELVMERLKNDISEDSIAKEVNQSSALNAVVKKGLFTNEEIPMFNLSVAEQKGSGIYGVEEFNDKYFVFNIIEVQEPRVKELNEIRGTMTSAYQNELEKEWIENLRAKYEVKVHEDVLYNLK